MRFAHNPETGETVYQQVPGGPWQVASEEMLRQEKLGGGAALGEDLLRGFRSIGAGVKSAVTGEPVDPAFIEETQAAERLRPQQTNLAGYAPDVAAVLGTLGIGLAPGVAARAGLGGLAAAGGVEGAVLGAGSNLENPRLGAALGGGLGALGGAAGHLVGVAAPRVVRGFQRGAQQADELLANVRGSRSLSAAETPEPSFESTVRVHSDKLTPEAFEELANDLGVQGKVLSEGDRRALKARAGTGEIAGAESRRGMEELARSNLPGDIAFGGVNSVRGAQEDIATRLVLREIGAPGTAERLGDDVVIDALEGAKETFEDVAKQVGDLSFTPEDAKALTDAGLEAISDDKALVQGFVDDIAADIAKSGEDKLSYAVAREYRTRLKEAITKASGRGMYERAQSLGDVEDVLDGIVERQASPSVREALSEARYRYRIYKTLERSTASIGPDAQLNVRSFLNAYQRRGNRFMRGSRKTGGEGLADTAATRGEELARSLRTLDFLTARTTPSSGTSERLMANAPLRGAQALGLGMLGI